MDVFTKLKAERLVTDISGALRMGVKRNSTLVSVILTEEDAEIICNKGTVIERVSITKITNEMLVFPT
jgi:hypothetical protein